MFNRLIKRKYGLVTDMERLLLKKLMKVITIRLCFLWFAPHFMCAPSLGPWGPKEDLQRIRASGLAAPVTPEGRQPIPSVLAAGAQLPILQKVGIINTKSLVLAFPGLSW